MPLVVERRDGRAWARTRRTPRRTPPTTPASTPQPARCARRTTSTRARDRRRAAAVGAVAAAAALGVSELLAGLLPGATSLVAAVGQVVIDLQPPGAKDFVVALFGTNDKLALEIVHRRGRARHRGRARARWRARRFDVAAARVRRVRGRSASSPRSATRWRRPRSSRSSAAVSVGVGLWVLGWLVSAGAWPAATDASAAATMPDWSRRSFLIRAGAVGVAAVVGGHRRSGAARAQRSAPRRRRPALPPASELAPLLDPAQDLSTDDRRPDAARHPQRPSSTGSTRRSSTRRPGTADWTLRIHGLVDRETTLTWEELLGLPMFEQYVTIACVSNEVGGDLVGNAKWTGVRLRDVLEIAGVQASATQLVGRSVDGWTAGMPTAWVMDPAREPMIAVKMNDEPLPPDPRLPGPAHRPRPVRLRVGDQVAHGARADDARGVRRLLGPARLGQGGADPDPVADRHAASAAGVAAGRVPIAGIAWAPDRGISRVEVAIDGVWRDARLSRADLGHDLGPVGRSTGTRHPATTRSRSARRTATASSRRSADAARPGRRPRLAQRDPVHVSADDRSRGESV